MGRPANKKYAIGTIYDSESNGKFEILEYESIQAITVRFIETGYTVKTRADKVKSGKIKDKLFPSIYGVGFVGDGEYKTGENGKPYQVYSIWTGIISRCYNENNVAYNRYGGSGIFVCKEWHNFQNFAEWYFANKPNDGKDYEIDKDINAEEVKIYSPDVCIFVTPQRNTEKARSKTYTMRSPSGELVEFYNMSKFCRENNLCLKNLNSVYHGKKLSCQGWTKC